MKYIRREKDALPEKPLFPFSRRKVVMIIAKVSPEFLYFPQTLWLLTQSVGLCTLITLHPLTQLSTSKLSIPNKMSIFHLHAATLHALYMLCSTYNWHIAVITYPTTLCMYSSSHSPTTKFQYFVLPDFRPKCQN